MRPRGLHLDPGRDHGIIAGLTIDFGASRGGVEGHITGQVLIERSVSPGSDPITGSEVGPTWGERWRYEDPFHWIGAIPIAGIPYRVAVVSGSYLLDLFTAEAQGITPISFPANEKPGWLNIQTAW